MSGTKQDNSKYILKNMTDEDYNQNLTYLTTISSYAASECHPMPPEAIAVMISEIAKKYEEVDAMAKELGSTLRAPFMTVAFMSLLVIPELKLGDVGLFDGKLFAFTDLME